MAKIFKLVTFLIMFIPAALQYGVGVDYFSYVYIFNKIARYGTWIVEPGWVFLNRLVYDLGGNAQHVIALAAFLIYFFVFCELDRKKWFLCVPAYFIIMYVWSLTTLRQMLVVSMVYCSINRFNKGKKISAIGIFILSYFFHKSTLFYLPIYLICKILKLNKYLLSVIFIVVLIITERFSAFFVNVIFNLMGLTQYANYLTSSWSDAIERGAGRFVRYIVYATLLLFYPETKPKTIILPCYLFLICIEVFSVNLQIINRISRGILFIYLPLIWDAWSETKNREIRMTVYIFCFLLLFVRNFVGRTYISIFDH